MYLKKRCEGCVRDGTSLLYKSHLLPSFQRTTPFLKERGIPLSFFVLSFFCNKEKYKKL